MKSISTLRLLALAISGATVLGGCSGDMSDLETWVSEEKAKRVAFRSDLPEVEPYEVYTYSADSERSPFVPTQVKQTNVIKGPDGPDPNRNPEHLESFSLDSLRMVGSLNSGGISSALVQTNDGLIHRVRPGNYAGENYGRVTSIDDSSIKLVELVPNGLGGWAEREAAIGLSD
ncbi:MAG: pilus assembly protein PilP [Gammaproteobacteria bacterium]